MDKALDNVSGPAVEMSVQTETISWGISTGEQTGDTHVGQIWLFNGPPTVLSVG